MSEYVDSNWCPDCGEPRGVCRCEDEFDDDTYTDQDAENHICPKCHGTGIARYCDK